MASFLQSAQKSIWLGWLLDNPLFIREVRRRMRGKLFSWSLILYIIALGLVCSVIIVTSYPSVTANISLREQITKVNQIGIHLYDGVRALELFIAVVIAPLLTSGLASSEKEKDTFDFLRVTTLRPRTFIGGCLLVTSFFLLMVFCCTLPVTSLAFIFGGVSLTGTLIFNLKVFVTALVISSMGMFLSTMQKRSVSTLGVMGVLNIFVLFIFGANFLRAQFMGGRGATYVTFYMMGVAAVAASLCLIGAARRLYEPDNRILNYKQFSGFALLWLGLAGGLIYISRGNAMIRDFYFTAAYIIGFCLVLFAVLNFSAGRVERGDEVWNLRMKRPLFQRVPDDLLFVALVAALWAVASTFGATAVGGSHPLMVSASLPGALAGVALAVAMAYGMNGFIEQRNRGMAILLVSLALIWVAVPLLGMLVSVALKATTFSGTFWADAKFYFHFSPVYHLIESMDGTPDTNPWGVLAAQLALAIPFVLVTRTALWRKRTRVSYQWVSRPVEIVAESEAPTGAPMAG